MRNAAKNSRVVACFLIAAPLAARAADLAVPRAVTIVDYRPELAPKRPRSSVERLVLFEGRGYWVALTRRPPGHYAASAAALRERILLRLDDTEISHENAVKEKRRRGDMTFLSKNGYRATDVYGATEDTLFFESTHPSTATPSRTVALSAQAAREKLDPSLPLQSLSLDSGPRLKASLLLLRRPVNWQGPFKEDRLLWAYHGTVQIKIGDRLEALGDGQLARIPAETTQPLTLLPGPETAQILQVAVDPAAGP